MSTSSAGVFPSLAFSAKNLSESVSILLPPSDQAYGYVPPACHLEGVIELGLGHHQEYVVGPVAALPGHAEVPEAGPVPPVLNLLVEGVVRVLEPEGHPPLTVLVVHPQDVAGVAPGDVRLY